MHVSSGDLLAFTPGYKQEKWGFGRPGQTFWEDLEEYEDNMSQLYPFFDPRSGIQLYNDPTLENLIYATLVPGAGVLAMIGASSLNTVPGQGYTMRRGMMMRVDSYRAIAMGAARTGRFVAVTGIRAVPVVGAAIGVAALVGGMYYGIRSYYHYLASLEWVPSIPTFGPSR